MRARTMICPCEDVELHEIEQAVGRGYAGLEEIKRVTGAITGPCQGRYCLAATIRVLAVLTETDPEELGGITHRAPVQGVPLAALAGCPAGDPDDAEAQDPDASGEPTSSSTEAGDA